MFAKLRNRFLTTLTLCGSAGAYALAQSGNSGAAPASLQTVGGDNRIVAIAGGPQNSARAAATAAAQGLAQIFDARPALSGAVGSSDDRELQAAFTATRGGQPIRGILCVNTSAGVAWAIWDGAERFPQSSAELLRTAEQHFGRTGIAAASEPLQQQMLPDGSGTMMLPASWRISSAAKGAVDASGPDGSFVSLGIAIPVFHAEAAPTLFNGGQGCLLASFCDPVRAVAVMNETLSDWSVAMAMQGALQPQTQIRNVRVLEAQPLQWAAAMMGPGQAALVLWEGDVIHPGAAPRRYRALSTVYTAPIDQLTWFYYHSSVYSPVEHFDRNIKTLISIWCGWRVSDHVIRERLQKAAESMREINRIYREVHEDRSRTFNNISTGWGHLLRGDWPMEDTHTGRRADIDHTVIDNVVAGLNQAAGEPRYRVVPTQELNP